MKNTSLVLIAMVAIAMAACGDDPAGSTETFTVTVNQPQGGIINASPTVAEAGTMITLSNTPAADYVFVRYTVNGVAQTDNTFNLTGNVTVSGVFNYTGAGTAPNTYIVTFSSNGGSEVNSQAVVSGGLVIPMISIRDGYTIDGWYKESTFATKWNFAADTVTGNLTLYAKWNQNAPGTVTVTFDTCGGSWINPQNIPSGGYAAQPVTPTRTGYTFDNWYIDPEYTAYFSIAVPVSASRTVYAKWNLITYSVRYEKNAADATGTMENSAHTYDVEKALSANGFYRTGYAFGGWNTKADGTGTSYTDSQSVKNLSVTQGETVTLYAQWYHFISMAWISAGTFTMGSPPAEPDRYSDETQHQVTLTTGFYMGKYPVTQRQYQAVMGSNPSYFTGSPASGEVQENRPVEQVSWYDAIVFCNKLSMAEGLSPAYRIGGSTDHAAWGTVPTSSDTTWNSVEIVSGSNGYRLPTEAQWEYACRAGTTTVFNTGESISDDTGWYSDNSGSKTHEVGKKPANAWGLYDMHGNVWEWCWDWYGAYASEAQSDPTGAVTGTYRVIRGGSWLIDGPLARSAFRNYRNPSGWDFYYGFRLVRPAL